jgi:hypothetical protein
VLFEGVRYSVPRHVAFEPVTVKAYVERVVLVHKGQVVASHRRSRTAGDQVLEPTHFLAALERKPAYLDHTGLFKGLTLPAAFGELRERLARELGERTGTRHYIRVLQLLGRHGAAEVARAIEACLPRQALRAEFVEQKLASSAAAPAAPAAPAGPLGRREPPGAAPAWVPAPGAEVAPHAIPQVYVPAPDLRRFDALLSLSSSSNSSNQPPTSRPTSPLSPDEEGEDRDGSDDSDSDSPSGPDQSDGHAAEARPQGAEAADDAGRACEAGA